VRVRTNLCVASTEAVKQMVCLRPCTDSSRCSSRSGFSPGLHTTMHSCAQHGAATECSPFRATMHSSSRWSGAGRRTNDEDGRTRNRIPKRGRDKAKHQHEATIKAATSRPFGVLYFLVCDGASVKNTGLRRPVHTRSNTAARTVRPAWQETPSYIWIRYGSYRDRRVSVGSPSVWQRTAAPGTASTPNTSNNRSVTAPSRVRE
jgi:hypothetical protein